MEDWGKPQIQGEVRAFLGAVDSDAGGYAAITYCQEIRLHDKAEPLMRLFPLPYSPFPSLSRFLRLPSEAIASIFSK